MKFLVNNNYFVICKTLKRPTEKSISFLNGTNFVEIGKSQATIFEDDPKRSCVEQGRLF